MSDPFGRLMQEVGQFRLLDKLDEQELFAKLDKGVDLYERLEGNVDIGVLSDEDQETILQLVAAQQILFNCNMRLVVSLAKKLMGTNMMEPLDLIQEGSLGLEVAIRRNDYTRGLKFSTYATNWVRQGMTRAIGDKARTIRLPVHLHEEWLKFGRERKELTIELGRDPTNDELMKHTGRSEKQLRTFANFGAAQLPSLDSQIEEGGEEFYNKFADGSTLSFDDYVEATAMQEDIDAIFLSPDITEREKLVVSLRFGVFREELNTFAFGDSSYEEVVTEGPMTLDDVGSLLGVTRERIRQIEKKALGTISERVF